MRKLRCYNQFKGAVKVQTLSGSEIVKRMCKREAKPGFFLFSIVEGSRLTLHLME